MISIIEVKNYTLPIAEFVKEKTQLSEKTYNHLKNRYVCIELNLRLNEYSIPSWTVSGPLNYSMTLKEMHCVITEKFKTMVQNHQLLKEGSISNRNELYPISGRGDNNLTRIWGQTS